MLTLALAPSGGLAQSLVPFEQCAIIVASRQTIIEAREYIQNNGIEDIATVFEAKNGWLAISVGTVPLSSSKQALAELKSKPSFPSDAYCSTGKAYVRVVAAPKNSSSSLKSAVSTALDGEFDARPLSSAEKRFLQAALALEGYYKGLLDGVWGSGSQEAFERFTYSTYSSEPLNVHAVTLIMAVIDEVVEGGWQSEYISKLDMSVAMPTLRIELVESRNNRQKWQDSETGLEFIFDRFDNDGATGAHQAMLRAHTGQDGPYTVRKPGFAVTSISSAGKLEYLRSDFIDNAWSMVYIAAPLTAKNYVGLASSSLTRGYGEYFDIPKGGHLDGQIREFLAYLDEPDQTEDKQNSSEPNSREHQDAAGSGSAFFVNDEGYALTNAHVVDGCRFLKLNGFPAEIVSISDSFDLAAVKTDASLPSTPLWFSASPAKLNSDVTIAGFPLHGLLGGLNVSRGAVSSLKGIGGTETTMQITAPVQPGNSGGPAVNSQGEVVGVVVAKLDALLVAREIGDIPENVGFAVRGELAQLFLTSNGIPYEKSSGNAYLSGEELAERLEKSTALLECNK
ncbi:trypsin-like peptidase domain-containing protein [Ruegeria sp. WL0004]|uniref:Trypsin-like peptidase domain-containing protein n=1 Tax=Ruegeria marisflavi TaxID=2984152 RepID=A0ABT2WTY2_9RHOB|nr:trypsin-like peptidase domain-containing protein [Ruegeria sp. WL0004]